MTLSTWHLAELENRSLDVDVATRMGIYSGKRVKDGLDDRGEPIFKVVPDHNGTILCFPFIECGVEISTKYRETKDGRKKLSQTAGRPKTFFNCDVLYDEHIMQELEDGIIALVITEGEPDCVASVQCGHYASVSVPNGAQLPARDKKTGKLIAVPEDAADIDPEDDEAFAFINRHWERLARVKHFYLAVDADEAGQRLAKELARRLDPARCFLIDYPKDPCVVADRETGELRPCKDLNEVLQHFGPEGVQSVLGKARPWPVAGLFAIADFPDEGELETLPMGLDPELDEHILLYPGAFMVLTGVPNTGKSEVAKQIIVNMAMRYGWHTAMFPGEEMVKPFLERSLKTKYLRRHYSEWTPEESARADEFLARHVQVIAQDDRTDDDITLDKLLKLAATSVFRFGTKLLVIDPWNEIEHERPAHESLTEYVGKAIRKIKKFAKSYGVCVIVVAHPKKVESQPNLYDISDCYSEDTEVLTKRGWLRHAEITLEDEVMGFDPKTDNLDWARPSRVASFDHDGEMVRFQGYGYDLLVSPNHRMVVKPAWKDPKGTQAENGLGRPTKYPKDQWSFTTAREIGSGNFIMPKAGMAVPGDDPETLLIDGKIFPAAPFAELVGWYLAEGSWQSSGLSLCQAAGEKADHIDGLIVACGLSATRAERPDPRGFQTMVTWYFGARTNPELVRWIRDKAGRGSSEKRVPYPFFAMSARLKAALLQGYIDGDGHRPTARDGIVATTTSKQLSDDLMRIAVEIGTPVTGHERTPANPDHAVQYQINFGREARRQVALRGARNSSIELYSGKIWCLTMPTGAYVVRRNGKVTICGNSAHWYNKADLSLIIDTDDPLGVIRDFIIPKIRFVGITGKKGKVQLRFNTRLQMYEPMAALAAAAPF